MSLSETPESEPPRQQSAPLATAARFLIPALLLIGGIWFGLRALQKTQTSGETETSPPNQGPPPSQVVVAPVQELTARNLHRVVGTLRAVQRADVAAREDGAVNEVLVDEGDLVEKHQILVRLDPRRIEAQLAQAQATLTASQSLIDQRKAEQSRTATDLEAKRKLFTLEAISESELLDAEREAKVSASQEKSARDQVTAAAAALKLLEVRRDDLVIRAPFDARVVTRHTEPGEWLRPGDSVLTLVSNGKLEAWLQVPERYAASINNQSITVEVGSQKITANKLRPLPEANSTSRVVTLIADIPDPDNTLVPGLSVTADIPVSDDTPRLAVPADAIVTTFAGPAVFRATPNPQGPPIAERLPVTILFQRDGIVFIESESLSTSDLIVIEGNERLFPGQPLAPLPTPENGTASHP